ncbi:MAG: hypothetical protein PHG82_02905 [Candidatus Gracilibacteria bacterium]|nr:hypothetical protein [Candidatus Gracilibacteria bacterium]
MKNKLKFLLISFYLLFSVKISNAAIAKDIPFSNGGPTYEHFSNSIYIILLIFIIYFTLTYFFKREKISKKVKIIVNIILLILFSLFILWQSYGLFIDIYNFKQLEKVNIILKYLKISDKPFYNLKIFNEIYKSDIKPINNCYYISNYNGDEKYIFGFKLESLIYRYIYGTKYYAYPKYDIPYRGMCISGGCYDGNKDEFEYLISNPCKE